MKDQKHWLCLAITADQAEILSYYMQHMLDRNSVGNREWVEYVRDEAIAWSVHKRNQDERKRKHD
jgi:hypothetical protein